MTAAAPPPETEAAAAERIARLADQVAAIADAQLRSEVGELLQLVLEWHRAGLERIFAAAAGAPHLEAALAAWRREPLLAGLLELHGLAVPVRPAPPGGLIPLTALARPAPEP